MTLFPSVLTSYSTKVNGQVIDASDVNNPQTDITQIEAVIGVAGANSVVGTYEYFVKSPASDGGGHVQGVNKGGTNFTSYNKGDLLVGKSSSVISKLAVGSDGAILKADSTSASGVSWGAGASSPNIRIFSTLGSDPLSSVVSTWSKPSLLSYVIVELQAGGGGAGGGAGGNNYCPGAGGGGYSRKVIQAGSILGNEASVITAGGGIAGSNGNGTAGQNSTFKVGGGVSSVVAFGGPGGTGGAITNTPGGDGGGAVGGDLNIIGGSGGRSGANATGAAYGGFGGGAILGGSISNVEGNSNGKTGVSYGGGGAGSSGSQQTGGAGAPGIVIIYEY